MELFHAVDSHVEFYTVYSLDSVIIVLFANNAFILRHSLLQAFVTSTMNSMIFLGSNNIMCALKI